MNKGLKSRKSLIALILFAGLFLTVYLLGKSNIFQIGATPQETPKDVRVTNITDSSFTLSYVTDNKVAGSFNFGTDPSSLDELVLDNRDQLSQTLNKYNVHYLTVRGLEPQTTYYFLITSGKDKYSDNGKVFAVQTGNVINYPPPNTLPLTGKVKLTGGSIPPETIIYIKIPGAQDLSAISVNGSYLVPLNNVRNTALNGYLNNFSGNSTIQAVTSSLTGQLSFSSSIGSNLPDISLSSVYAPYSESTVVEYPKQRDSTPRTVNKSSESSGIISSTFDKFLSVFHGLSPK